MAVLVRFPAPHRARTVIESNNPVDQYINNLGSEASRRTMMSALENVARILTDKKESARAISWESLTYSSTASLRAKLAEKYEPATVNRHLAALRGVLKECWRLGKVHADQFERVTDLKPVRGEHLPSGRALSNNEISALLSACISDLAPAGARDAALIVVMAFSGLRRAEVADLFVDDWDRENRSLRVRNGKGGKERLTYLPVDASGLLEGWMDVRSRAPGPLFCPVRKNGTVVIRFVSPQAIFNACRKRAERAGIEEFGPHDLRRTFVTGIIEKSGDLSVAQRLAGHASVVTTTRYDRRGEVAKKNAVDLLSIHAK